MTLSVTKLAEELVVPCEPTPSATLPLSSIDHAMGLRFHVEMVSVYGHGHFGVEPVSVIREALAKALVPYYPVAGRLVMSEEGELEVACTGDGVWFVEATTHYSISDLKNLEFPLAIPKGDLLPSPPAYLNPQDMILMMQITQFKCGGFVVGVKFSHYFFDGIGASQFLKAVGDLAGGLAQPAVQPIWFRDAIPAPPMFPKGPPTTFFSFVQSLFDLPIDSLNKIKEEVMTETSHRCTTFEAAAALLWRCRTRAIELEPHADVRLVFPTNVRRLLHPLLPPQGGYYGNGIYCVTVTSTSERVAHAPLAEVVSLIRDAKASLPAKFAEWAVGDFDEDPYKVPLGYDALNLSDWRSLGFYEVDYGCGAARCVAPLNNHAVFAGGILLRRPLAKQGVRFSGEVVTKEHEETFVEEIKKYV